MTVELWRHKPIVKEVIEYTGDNADEIVAWAGEKAYIEFGRLVIRTPHMDLVVEVGEFIIKGIEGEFYPVPRSILVGSYDRVGVRP